MFGAVHSSIFVSLRGVLVVLGSSGLLTGCERGSVWQPDHADRSAVAVSAEQKEAAMALSLFPSTQQADKSDYGDAVDCAAAVGHLSSRVGNSGLASEADLQAIRRAAQIFEARAFRLAGTEQKTRDQTTADLEAAKTEVAAKPTDAARLAIGCVNRLASPS